MIRMANFLGVYIPGSQTYEMLKNLVDALMKFDGFKKEMSNYIRLEMEANKQKYSKDNDSNNLSYEMLTRGNVNMQAKMAASGYDVYGRTVISSNSSANNNDLYRRMKNKINYGTFSPSYENRGEQKVV
jgi:hypothetical protein